MYGREAIRAPSTSRLILNSVDLGKDVSDLRLEFELGVVSSAVEMEHVLVCLRKLNS